MPIFALYTFDDQDQTALDSATVDGAQNGVYLNGAAASDGQVQLDGSDDQVKIYPDTSFQMDRGTLAIDFTQGTLPSEGAVTLLSRDSAGETNGGFHIDILSDGSIQITHEIEGADPVVYTTDAGFVSSGDSVSISYSWDYQGEGGNLVIENTTSGSDYTADVPNTVTMDEGDMSRPWVVGAGQSTTDPDGLNNIDQHFSGSVSEFSLSDTVDNGAPNDDPVANPDTAVTDEDVPVTIPVLSNDTDTEGQTLTVVGATAGNGSVAINDDGTLTYTPAQDFNGTDEISYTITDPRGGSSTSTVTVTVNPVNDDPVANDDSAATPYQTPVTIAVLENDTDVDGDTLSVTGTPSSANGSVTVNDDGSLTFTPDAGFSGTATVDYTISDGNGGEAAGSVSILVTPPGTGPGGRDGIVWGTDGGDYIDGSYTGDNDGDMVDAGDAILPGTSGDDDVIYAGAGDDTVYAGAGNDLVYGGTGNDIIDGGAGDDTIHGGPGDDILMGGSGDDVIYGEEGDDQLHGNAGNDTIYGGTGTTLVHGNEGDDVIYGGGGPDSLNGDEGNDTIYAGDHGNSELYGGADDDALYAGLGGDLLYGGAGNDTLYGGAGADIMYGGADRDIFVNVGANDIIDGGEEGDDWDTLDLTGAGPLRIEYSPDNPENGTIYFLDGDGNVSGTASFVNIENVIPCFTPGSRVATPRGEVLVESLREGDKIITRDNGIQEIRWVGSRRLSGTELQASPHLRPVLIKKGSLGHGLPERDMMVSPNHRMLVANDRTQLYFDEHEVLVAAKHLVGSTGIQRVSVPEATYIHFMFDQHQVVLADGAWTESFQPGDFTLKGMGEQRSEILELFPELKTPEGMESYIAARRTLRGHEAALLIR